MYFIFSFLFIAPLYTFIKQINLEYRVYPRWLKRRENGSRIPCLKDEDCPFPSACCNDPFFPQEFCCNGWNYRKLEYAFSRQIIQSNQNI